MAADVYSSRGLYTMAKVLEKLGRLAEAEDYLHKQYERYDNPSDLVAFLVRRSSEQQFREALEQLRVDLFPDGTQPVSAKDIAGSPPAGVRIVKVGDAAGPLRVDDLVVAMDRLRLKSLRQLRAAGQLSTAADAQLLVFREGRTIEVSIPRSSLGQTYFQLDPP